MRWVGELADPFAFSFFPPFSSTRNFRQTIATVWRRVGRVGGFPRNSAAVALNYSPPVQQQSSTNPKSNRKRQTRQRQQQRRVCLEAPDPILSGRLSNKGQASLSILYSSGKSASQSVVFRCHRQTRGRWWGNQTIAILYTQSGPSLSPGQPRRHGRVFSRQTVHTLHRHVSITKSPWRIAYR